MPPTPTPPNAAARRGDRIAKLLARAGIASRREVERMIAEGRVALDGVAIDTPATILTSLAGVTVDGEPVAAPAAARLFVYHKPPGLLVTERDPAGRPTIYDRLPAGLPRVVPVGRLDLATEGLLLLTTDGGLKRQLELPATGVERTYRARAYGPISQARLEELIEGIEIDGIRYGGIDANLERRTGANSWIELTLTEGKNREVRRVLEYLGLEVSRLIRTRYGPFVLGDMAPGDVGEIRQNDLEVFRKTLKGGKPAGAEQPVHAQPLPTPAPPPVATERPKTRAAPAPAGREDGERRRATDGRPPRTQPGQRRPDAAGGARRAPATGSDNARGARPRRPASGDDRAVSSPTGSDRRRDRAAAFAAERDQRPRAFGDRTRAAAAAARASRPPSGDRARALPADDTERSPRDERGGRGRDRKAPAPPPVPPRPAAADRGAASRAAPARPRADPPARAASADARHRRPVARPPARRAEARPERPAWPAGRRG